MAAKTLSGPSKVGDGERGGWPRPTGADAGLTPHPAVLSGSSTVKSCPQPHTVNSAVCSKPTT